MAFSSGIDPSTLSGLELGVSAQTKGGAKPRTVNGITTIDAKGTFSSTGGEKGPDIKYYLCNNSVYGQTLFLGCTVKSYNCSLGWGAEAGRLEVELVHDDCVYPELRDYNGNFVTKPIFSDAEDHYVNNRANNGFQRDIDGNPLVPGKVFYRPDKNKGKIVSDYWYYADPGFFGERQYDKNGKILNEAIDLMGVPAYFRHDNFAFNGIIQSWENTGGEGGTKTYKVIIESPANLLNNISLILDQYSGTIFRVKSGREKGFPAYVQNEANERYGGTIYEQNIPNVVNVYGFWEQFAFGNSGRNEEGMPAVNIINGIHYLLSSRRPDNRVYKFSPFGRILGRSPKYSTGDGSAPGGDSIGTDFRMRYGLGISTNGSNDGSITSIFNVPFIGMGLVRGVYDAYNVARIGYYINLFEILDPYLLKYYRISNNSMTISELIGNICAATGKEYFVNLNLEVDTDTRSVTYGEIIPSIYVSTINKLYPTADNAVESFITWISSLGTIVNSYSKGKSYNATEPVRTMLIGGKQQRLYQVKNPKYSIKQCVTYYNPYINQFVTNDHSTFNFYKTPNVNSTRNPLLYSTIGNDFSGRVELAEDSSFYNYDSNWQLLPNTVPPILGNFNNSFVVPGLGEAAIAAGQTPVEPLSGYYNENNMPYPASDNDAICPYFGRDLSTGAIRRVFSGSNGFIVEFSFREFGIATGFEFTSPGYVYIHEHEIRAAMVSIDSFAAYLATLYYDHLFFGLPQVEIFSKIIIPYFGLGRFRWMMDGLINVKNLFNLSGNKGLGMMPGLSANFSIDGSLWDMLTKIQTFIGNIGNTYYGKQFMINIPIPQAWKDSGPFLDSYGNPVQVSVDAIGNPVYLQYGSQKWNFSFEPTDFAWEEPLSVIDENLTVGTNSMLPFTQENGSIEAFLGYNNTYQYDYSAAFGTALFDSMRNSSSTDLFNFWKFDSYARSAYGQGNGTIGGDIYDYLRPSLDLNEGADNFATDLGYNSQTQTSDGFIDIPAGKVYTKATVEKTPQIYYKRNGALAAKLIVTTNGINLSSASADALRVNVAAADYMRGTYSTDATMATISAKVLALNPFFGGVNSQDTGNDQYQNIEIAKKAAIPSFAAIPILFNNAVYGPWISAPDRLMNKIFPNDNFQAQLLKLENLVGGTKVEINDGLVPWNYGGMRVLDEAAVQLIGVDNNYQATTEQGQLVTYGLPLLNMGEELKAAGATFNGPIVNNVQVQISEGGPITTYSFRTYTRKLTLFNKENADRLQKNANTTIKLQREANQKIRLLTNKLAQSIGTVGTNEFYGYQRSKLKQYSPMGVLVGYSTPFISSKSTISPLTNTYPNKYTPGSWTKDTLQSFTQVSVQDIRELAQEFDNDYASKSIMSLDGIFAPISFYPTQATIPIKKYNTAYCPVCNGSRQHTYKGITYFCEYCQPTDTSSTKTKVYSSVPPFILSNQADDTILNNPNAIDDLLKTLQKKKINYINLNPIIMPVGELRNAYAQDSDYNAHNIDIVGRGLIPPESISYKHNLSINQTYIDPITGEETPGLEIYDQNDPFSDLDAKSKDFDNRQKIRTTNHQLNCRFLGLKGPLTMAGWGFDLEGFPVPNSSGEPQSVDKLGRPLKIRDKKDYNGSFEPNYPGTILGKNQKWDSTKNEWTEPYKEDTFYKSWGLRSDLWPAGPVDLRWDESRGVWSASNDTKRFVNVQLEDNLLSPFPARGFLNAIDKTTPLPSGLRRMVFVKDSEGSYCAPRGAKLLCYYDDNTGFYEPISKNYIMTSGKILDNGTAKIFDTYARGFDQITGMPEKPNEIEVTFHNMMNFSIVRDKQIGIFAFMQNQWKLISTNSCDNVNI